MEIKVRMKSRHGIKYLKALPNNVETSLRELYSSGEIQDTVLSQTTKGVPKDTGKLRRSAYRFKDFYKETPTHKINATVRYRALNERTGFNYAFIQEIRRYKEYTTPGTDFLYLFRGLTKSAPLVKAKTAAAVMEGVNKGAKTHITVIRGK